LFLNGFKGMDKFKGVQDLLQSKKDFIGYQISNGLSKDKLVVKWFFNSFRTLFLFSDLLIQRKPAIVIKKIEPSLNLK
jgi:hypothetical protein